MIVNFSELDYSLWEKIAGLYKRKPITHAYLFYDVVYDCESTDVSFLLEDKVIRGYLLVWHGGSRLAVHLWGDAKQLVSLLPQDLSSIIQLYNEELLEYTLNSIQRSGKTEVKWYYDMVVDDDSFKPYDAHVTVRLGTSHTEFFAELVDEWAEPPSREKIHEILSKWRWYGIFDNGKLVSVASAYIRLPEVWIIGGVYTRLGYRNKGYGKSVTSAITRDAIASGAVAILHVAENNEPAKKVYSKLGYRYLGKRPWIYYNPNTD